MENEFKPFYIKGMYLKNEDEKMFWIEIEPRTKDGFEILIRNRRQQDKLIDNQIKLINDSGINRKIWDCKKIRVLYQGSNKITERFC